MNTDSKKSDPLMLLRALAAVAGVSPVRILNVNEARHAFLEAANGLRPRELLAILLHTSGFTLQAVGDVLGCSRALARKYRDHAIRKLQRFPRVLLVNPFVIEIT